jgi:membrane-associated phospholipid phosphatase
MAKHEGNPRRAAVALAITLALVWGGNSSWAAAAETVEYRLDSSYLRRFAKDLQVTVGSPFHWHGGDFARLAAFSGAGLLLFAFDQEIQDRAQENRSSASDDAAFLFSPFGNGGYLLGFSAVLYAAGEIGRSEGLRKTALLSVESLAAATFFIWAGKLIVGRARPSSGESSRVFRPFSLRSGYWSMPSGHAASAFAVAATLAGQSRNAVVDILSYSLAALAGLSRIEDNKHWASDVFIGSAVGYFAARKIAALNRQPEARSVSWGFGFQAGGGGQALTFSLRF